MNKNKEFKLIYLKFGQKSNEQYFLIKTTEIPFNSDYYLAVFFEKNKKITNHFFLAIVFKLD
jgi:hypothetical protein